MSVKKSSREEEKSVNLDPRRHENTTMKRTTNLFVHEASCQNWKYLSKNYFSQVLPAIAGTVLGLIRIHCLKSRYVSDEKLLQLLG